MPKRVIPTQALYQRIVHSLVTVGKGSPYKADANEPDPRYLGYGVRAPAMKQLIGGLPAELAALTTKQKLQLATRLIESGYGEQKTVALHLLDQIANYFTPDKFSTIDRLVRGLHGWSKIDSYTGSFLSSILSAHPTEFLMLLAKWNVDEEQWLRRASVVIFTRKVALSGRYTDVALRHCENLKHDAEDHVLKGVGWCLKDLMRSDKQRILQYVVDLRRQKVSSTITLYALRDVKGAERKAILGND